MTKLSLPHTQLVLYDGAHDPTAARVIEFVTGLIEFGAVTLHRPPTRESYAAGQEAQAKLIPALLPAHLDYQLQIECDGFPIHPDRWHADFLKWDYIGAPWPDALTAGTGRVGNGGCSLRSRRFIEAIAPVPYTPGLPSDVWFCQYPPVIHAVLKAGARYAPIGVAMRFAIEHPIPEHPPDWSFRDAFAFHKLMPDWRRLLQLTPPSL